MGGRLLITAAVLLVALMGRAAKANEPGTVKSIQSVDRSSPEHSLEEEEVAIPDATLPVNWSVGRTPRVILIIDTASANCRRELERLRKPNGEFAAMQAQGWKIGSGSDNHVQLIDRQDASILLQSLDAGEFPVVAGVTNGDIVRSFRDGCSTPLDAWTFGWLLKGVNERPKAPIPEAIRVATTNSYPLRGNHWTVDGDSNPTKETLVFHLRTVTHINYIQADWKLEDWSTEELRSLHDDLHEKYGPAGPTAAYAQPNTAAGKFSGANKALGKF
ncbi:MAG: hypothetical protein JWP89_5617 [Schlesneria sp.]|nr:hypothetical protein [Schlesneria sp.]